MPLLAIDTAAAGAVVDLTQVDDATWAGIWRQRTGDRLRCRACDQSLIAKSMTASGLRFFAHASVVPACPTHGESARHLQLKAAFADAFRQAGWSADLEVAGNGWRADVLVADGDDRRVAVEVQLAAIVADDVRERMARHAASGVETLWVVERRTAWTEGRPHVLVDGDRVVDSVLMLPARKGGPALAGPASIGRFVERLAQGRLGPVSDPDSLLTQLWWPAPVRATDLWQLDGCVGAHVQALARERERELARRAAVERRFAEMGRRRQERLKRNAEPMLASLQACQEWFARQSSLRIYFGGGFRQDPEAAVAVDWKPEVGIVVSIGAQRPMWVLAVAEPRGRSIRTDPRVGAWTMGTQPKTDVAGFAYVLTPETILDLDSLDLKDVPHPARRRRRW